MSDDTGKTTISRQSTEKRERNGLGDALVYYSEIEGLLTTLGPQSQSRAVGWGNGTAQVSQQVNAKI